MEPSRVRSLCIVVPCFDEEQVVVHTYRALCRVFATLPELRVQFCFVDDGSLDGTLSVLARLAEQDPRVRVVSLSRNFGHQAAITAGLDHADRRADAVLVMDADLETPPELVPRMLEELDRGRDVVLGVRRHERAVGVLRRLGSRWFYALFNRVSDVPITPGAPDFYLLSARAREALSRMPERSRFLRAMVTWLGFPRAYVYYTPGTRPSGRSKYTPRRMAHLASDALFAFSSAPIKLTLWVGLVSLLAGTGTLAYAGLAACAGDASGNAFLAGLLAFLCGFQLCALAAVGGYVVRNLEESRGRPLYLVQRVIHARDDDARLVELAGDRRLVDVAKIAPQARRQRGP